MAKSNNIVLKKVRTVKNRHITNKGVILGRNKLMGRYYDAGPNFVASFKERVLSKALQYYGLGVSVKVGWLLIKGLIKLGSLEVKRFNFKHKNKMKEFEINKSKSKVIYNSR